MQGLVHGHLSGFDRVLFRGSLRLLSYLTGMEYFLSRKAILMKDFLDWAETLSKKVAAESAVRAEREGRPVKYLASSALDKSQLALEMARLDGIKEGLIGVFTCVEPCMGYSIYRRWRFNPEQRSKLSPICVADRKGCARAIALEPTR